MKFLVVLVLAVFSGCNAQAEAPKPKLDALAATLWGYVEQATKTADDAFQIVKKTQFGQDMSARLTDSAEMATNYAATLREQLSPEAQEMIVKVSAEANVLREQAMTQLQPLTEDMKKQVEQLLQDVSTYKDMDSDTLKSTMVERGEALRAKVEEGMTNLQANLGNMEANLQNLKSAMASLAEVAQVRITQGAQQVKELATPYVAEMRDNMGKYDLQQLIALLQPPVIAN